MPKTAQGGSRGAPEGSGTGPGGSRDGPGGVRSGPLDSWGVPRRVRERNFDDSGTPKRSVFHSKIERQIKLFWGCLRDGILSLESVENGRPNGPQIVQNPVKKGARHLIRYLSEFSSVFPRKMSTKIDENVARCGGCAEGWGPGKMCFPPRRERHF